MPQDSSSSSLTSTRVIFAAVVGTVLTVALLMGVDPSTIGGGGRPMSERMRRQQKIESLRQRHLDASVWARGAWARIDEAPSGCVASPSSSGLALTCRNVSHTCCSDRCDVVLAVHPKVFVTAAKCLSCKSSGEEGGGDVGGVVLGDWRFSTEISTETSIDDASVPSTLRVSIPPLRCDRDRDQSTGTAAAPSITFDLRVAFGVDEGALRNEKRREPEAPASGAVPPEVCFASIGDWGRPTGSMLEVAALLSNVSRRRFVRFVISTGDNFYPRGVSSVNDRQWNETFEMPFSDAVLQSVPWFISAGDHDQYGLSPQLHYAKVSPRWRFPSAAYAEVVPLGPSTDSLGLVVLDSYTPKDRGFARQLVMLGDRLRRYAEDNSVVFSLVVNHAPVFSGGAQAAGGELAHRMKALRAKVKPVLDAAGAHAYLGGDVHTMEVLREGTVDYFVNGAGGGGKAQAAEVTPETVFARSRRDDVPPRGFMLHCWRAEERVLYTELHLRNGTVLFTQKTPGKPQARENKP